MLDIGFWELIAIGVIALLVIGPDRLPEVARYLGRWAGKARAYVDSVRNSVDKEMRLQELQDMMKQSERTDLYEMMEDIVPGSDLDDDDDSLPDIKTADIKTTATNSKTDVNRAVQTRTSKQAT